VLVDAVVTIGPAFTDNITAPASESSEGLEILTANFPSAGGDQGTIVFRAEQGVDDPAVQASMSDLFEAAKQIDGLETALGGDMFCEREPPNSEMLGLAFAILVLIAAFGSVVAMGVPIATAPAGVGVGVLLTALLSNPIEMADFAATIGIMIGLGVGIDYALFIVTRYREYFDRGDSVADTTGAALNTAGRAVLVAGVAVVVSLGYFNDS
jgi:RND superfamily putative drug exporter